MSRLKEENIHHAERMKLVRKLLGNVSQAYIARELGIPLHRIKAIEAGRTKISPELALKMEQKFHLNFKWLLTGEGEMFLEEQVVPVEDAPLVAIISFLRDVWKRGDPKERIWLEIQFSKCFPEFLEWRKKKEEKEEKKGVEVKGD